MAEDKIGSLKSNELFFIDWVYKVTERLVLITQSTKNQTELITQDDIDYVLKPLHKVWFLGEMPFYRTGMEMGEQNVTQGGLFADDILTTTTVGNVPVNISVVKENKKTPKIGKS